MATTAYSNRSSIVEALEAEGEAISWQFAFADALEAGEEAERFYRRTILPLVAKERWSEDELATLMHFEHRYQDMSRFSRQLMDGLVERPAPDLAALLWKLEYLFGEKRGLGCAQSAPYALVKAVMGDARRLLRRCAARDIRAPSHNRSRSLDNSE